MSDVENLAYLFDALINHATYNSDTTVDVPIHEAFKIQHELHRLVDLEK